MTTEVKFYYLYTIEPKSGEHYLQRPYWSFADAKKRAAELKSDGFHGFIMNEFNRVLKRF